MSRTKIITTEDIWNITNGGEMVFECELERIDYNKNVRSPFRKDDNPSLRLKRSSSGIIFFNDYGGSQISGNALDLLQHLYGLTFQQAIDKVWNDFNGNSKNLTKIKFEKKEVKPRQPKLIEFQECKFTDKHIKYFEPLGLDETYLNSKNVFAVCKFAIDKKVIKIPEHQYVFAYYAPDIDKCKLLTLGKDVKIKWLSNIDLDYLWNYHLLKDKKLDNLWVCKSLKDAILIEKHFSLNVIATQNENHKAVLRNKDKINKISNNVTLCYGADKQAIGESEKIIKETNWKNFTTPINCYNLFCIEDTADYFKEFGKNSLKNLIDRHNS
jgi:hypothetical protein